MTFALRELLWLTLLAPVTLGLGGCFWRRRLVATRAWAASGLWRRLRFDYRARRVWSTLALLAVAVAATVVGLAQPRWGQATERVEREGVDIVFVLDSSLSMSAGDVPPSREFVAKTLVRSMVRRLAGHRVALVQAEGEGVVMAPLTVDNAVIDLLLDTVEPGTLPTPGTGLNHALGLAAELFPQGSESHRVIVLLSDGEDHEGGLDDGIRQLAEQGIVAHALGIGTPQGAPLPVPGGGANELKRDRDGKIVVSRLGEDALRRLASLTDGTYLQITDAGDDLGVVLDAIDQMDRRGFSAETIEAQEDRFQWPLALAAICLLLFLVTAPVATSREPTA